MTKKMNVDTKSEVAKYFYSFASGYVSFSTGKLVEGLSYLLYLSCVGEEVSISVYTNGTLISENNYSMDYVMRDPNLIEIVKSFDKIDVDIDTFEVQFNSNDLLSISLNTEMSKCGSLGEYLFNKETGKIEVYFDKDLYMSLPESDKKSIKSNFLFSRAKGAWVSRAKFPNLWMAERVVKTLGLKNKGTVGEMISFAEQMERKAERAEARAERYEAKSEKAIEKGNALQKPTDSMRGDISFFTQPNINSSAGRAFTRRREKMLAAYERGFEEFKKSNYYAERAEAARATASATKPTDKSFCIRRIEEAEKSIRAQKKNLESYNNTFEKIRSGKEVKRYDGTIIEENEVLEWVEKAEMIIEQAISKSVYYHECLDELGGVGFSKENIKVGYVIEHQRWGRCIVGGTGPKNITYTILDGGAAGMGGTASYAEIVKVLSTDVKKNIEKHPFNVGDKYTVQEWDGGLLKRVSKEYEVIKVTDERVTLKCGSARAISRKPRRYRNSESATGWAWALGICDGIGGTIYKVEKLKE